ncbi:hypothetical protein Y032_0390g551 [Ancylostoma ceylanicum]|uniref:Uncharacterized protein n=1 Tax=Ancylostoma ceylanicum TaxID=53326 RepID=A0A016RSA9_9BILA|nr:hypothetical protein Y032_0390g551 [Ancylostoma ceylanicum]
MKHEHSQTELIAPHSLYLSSPRLRQFKMNQNESVMQEIRIVEMIRIDCHVTSLPRGAPYSRGCAENEMTMLVIAKMEKMPIDCHAPLVIIPLSSGVS